VRRSRALTELDRAAWSAFARQIKILPGRHVPPEPVELPPSPPGAPRAAPMPASRPAPVRPNPVIIGDQPPGIDNATWRRLRSGKLPVERTLDFHGMTAQRAHAALERFLHNARVDGVRVVEVVTGRGSGEAGGVLKREVPLWLNQPAFRPFVLAVTFSHARNTGALRILLRR
jgi:DNA-nicking Smr family endonuclease